MILIFSKQVRIESILNLSNEYKKYNVYLINNSIHLHEGRIVGGEEDFLFDLFQQEFLSSFLSFLISSYFFFFFSQPPFHGVNLQIKSVEENQRMQNLRLELLNLDMAIPLLFMRIKSLSLVDMVVSIINDWHSTICIHWILKIMNGLNLSLRVILLILVVDTQLQ